MRVPPLGILKVAILGLWLSVSVSGQTALASLSGDLLALLLGGATQPVRAIVRGDVAVIQAVAARDQLPVHRVLDGMVVVQATPEQLGALRHVSGILSISRDALVAPFMTTSQKAIAADQARAATSGFLGIGAYPAVTGKGVGVAVIDSGIATSHQALSGKVTFSINFATGETTTDRRVRPRHAYRRHHRRIADGREWGHVSLQGWYRAGRAFDQRQGAGLEWLRLHE